MYVDFILVFVFEIEISIEEIYILKWGRGKKRGVKNCGLLSGLGIELIFDFLLLVKKWE